MPASVNLFYRFILEDFQRVCNKAPKTEPKTEKQQKLDFFILVRYNIPYKIVYSTLSRAAEGPGPVKPGNRTLLSRRCQILRKIPRDEDFFKCSDFSGHFFCFARKRTRKENERRFFDGKTLFYIRIRDRRPSGQDL